MNYKEQLEWDFNKSEPTVTSVVNAVCLGLSCDKEKAFSLIANALVDLGADVKNFKTIPAVRKEVLEHFQKEKVEKTYEKKHTLPTKPHIPQRPKHNAVTSSLTNGLITYDYIGALLPIYNIMRLQQTQAVIMENNLYEVIKPFKEHILSTLDDCSFKRWIADFKEETNE